jgi:hypothetical protein
MELTNEQEQAIKMLDDYCATQGISGIRLIYATVAILSMANFMSKLGNTLYLQCKDITTTTQALLDAVALYQLIVVARFEKQQVANSTSYNTDYPTES